MAAISWRAHDTEPAAAIRTSPTTAPSTGPAGLESPQPQPAAASTAPTPATSAAATTPAGPAPATPTGKPARSAYLDLRSPNWVGAWGISPENANFPAADNQTFRMIVHPTVGGDAIRIRLSNAFGDQPVTLTSATIARRTTGAAIDPATKTRLTFSGNRRRTVTIRAHDMAISDPVPFSYRYGDDLAVTFYSPGSVPHVTGHGHGAQTVTSYDTGPGRGDHTADVTGGSFLQSTANRYFLMGLDAYVPGAQGTVIAFGDSITDGMLSDRDRYNDYPNRLAARFNAAGYRVGVVNAGISGNTVLPCPPAASNGDPAVQRFDRDVLQYQAYGNVRAVIIEEGGNDLRACPATPADVAAGLGVIVQRAHGHGVPVFLGTYIPRVTADDRRVALNDWIRSQANAVEGIVDFDAALRDPADLGRQSPSTGTADDVHPGPAGYQMMADLVPLDAVVSGRIGPAAGR
jgi:lysophospholipase L1-like esterase